MTNFNKVLLLFIVELKLVRRVKFKVIKIINWHHGFRRSNKTTPSLEVNG